MAQIMFSTLGQCFAHDPQFLEVANQLDEIRAFCARDEKRQALDRFALREFGAKRFDDLDLEEGETYEVIMRAGA